MRRLAVGGGEGCTHTSSKMIESLECKVDIASGFSPLRRQ